MPSLLKSRVSAPTHSSQQAKRPGGGGAGRGHREEGASTSPLLSSWETSGPSSSGWNSLLGRSLRPVPGYSVTDWSPAPHLVPSILHTLCSPSPAPQAHLSPLPGLGKLGPGRLPLATLHSVSALPPPSPSSKSKGMFWSLGRMGGPPEEGGRGGGSFVLSVSEL